MFFILKDVFAAFFIVSINLMVSRLIVWCFSCLLGVELGVSMYFNNLREFTKVTCSGVVLSL